MQTLTSMCGLSSGFLLQQEEFEPTFPLRATHSGSQQRHCQRAETHWGGGVRGPLQKVQLCTNPPRGLARVSYSNTSQGYSWNVSDSFALAPIIAVSRATHKSSSDQEQRLLSCTVESSDKRPLQCVTRPRRLTRAGL